MRTVIDGKTDLRPLNSGDVSNIPLPYVQEYNVPDAIVVAADGLYSDTLTATDWGAGLDFYFTAFRFARTNTIILPNNEGFLIKISIQETGELLYVKTIQRDEDLIYTSAAGSRGWLQFYKRLRIVRRVLSTQTILIEFENHSANTFATPGSASATIYIFGNVV